MAKKLLLLVLILSAITFLSSRLRADTGTCGGGMVTLPFTDVMGNPFFCQIAAAYFSGLTNGTSATTYSPGSNVTRDQMSAFITRTLDQSLKRGGRRAALNQWWTTQSAINLGLTTVGTDPVLPASDGADIWVANINSDNVSRVRASDGRLLQTWSGAFEAYGVLVAMGRVFITGAHCLPGGSLYMINPTQSEGAVETVSNNLGCGASGISFDGARIWTANINGSVSIITPGIIFPWSTITTTAGFVNPQGILFDGTNIWVTDYGDNTLKKLDANGGIVQSITVGNQPRFPVFDGINIWVPNYTSNSVSIVRATGPLTGTILATLTGNGLDFPFASAFDGVRVLITNFNGDSVSIWKAADFTPIGSFSVGVGTNPTGACSDGVNFWITQKVNKLARF